MARDIVTPYLGVPRRDQLPVKAETIAAVVPLVRDGTLLEIFSSLQLPLLQVGFSDSEVEAFERNCREALLDEDHATLILRVRPDGSLDIVELEFDERCRVERVEFSLDEKFVWKAGDVHQVVIPAAVLEHAA